MEQESRKSAGGAGWMRIILPALWLLLMLAVMAVPYVMLERTLHYGLVVYDESPLSVSIANDTFSLWVVTAPMLYLLARFLHGGLWALLPDNRLCRALAFVLEWAVNVHLIVSCGLLALTVNGSVILWFARL